MILIQKTILWKKKFSKKNSSLKNNIPTNIRTTENSGYRHRSRLFPMILAEARISCNSHRLHSGNAGKGCRKCCEIYQRKSRNIEFKRMMPSRTLEFEDESFFETRSIDPLSRNLDLESALHPEMNKEWLEIPEKRWESF